MSELKKCPFCGGEAEWVTEIKCYGHGDFRKVITVICLTCCADTHIEKEEKDALELWNTRKPIERAIARLQELEDSICNARLLIEKDIYKDKETLDRVRKLLLQELAYNNAIAIIKEEVG